jgi:hypothetical protein
LGIKAEKLSEEEKRYIFELQDKLADKFFDNWLKKRNNVVKDVQN